MISPETLVSALNEHRVEYIVIGGFAVIAHGARRVTRDLDILPEPSDANLRRLQNALAALDARKLEAGGRDRRLEAADVAMVGLGVTLHTDGPAGRLDIVGAPAGAAPYPALAARAIETRMAGMPVLVPGLDDLIAMKRAAGRDLDLRDIADLTRAGGSQ